MNYGITINDLHSFKDLGLVLIEREIATPTKVKLKQSVPFMNGNYDFSDLYGSECYGERTLKYKFRLKCENIKQFDYKYTNILKWAIQGTQRILKDDFLQGFYFLVECEGDVSYELFSNNKKYSYITITFNAYPFKIGEAYEGNNLWDSFNFELDILQDTKFTVNGTSNVNIYNSSAIDIEPTIIASSQFEIVLDNKKYIVESGESKDYRFKLKRGNNNLTLKGNGTIEFRFRKEVL